MPKEDFNPIRDVGDLTVSDAARLISELQGTRTHAVDRESMAVAQQVADDFVRFVKRCIAVLVPLTDENVRRLVGAVEVDVDPGVGQAQFVRALWNTRGLDMMAIESPMNYFMTMCTLMENMRLDPQGKKETFLSLGCGPGLYETYLAMVSNRSFGSGRFRFVCVDFAPDMIAALKKVVKFVRREFNANLKNIDPKVDDMTVLRQVPTGSVNQIFCNNSLQWVPDWRAAVAQFRRVMKPDSLGLVHLFIHPHSMSAVEADGNFVLRLADVPYDQLFDELEKYDFSILHTRQFAGRKGSGQLGAQANRLYIKAQLQPQGLEKSWRDADVSSALTLV